MVARLEDNARSCGRQDVWLLTTTAERFFERAGYVRVNREDVPSEVRLCRAVRVALSVDGLLHAKAAAHVIFRTHRRAAGIKLISAARRPFVTGSCWPLTAYKFRIRF